MRQLKLRVNSSEKIDTIGSPIQKEIQSSENLSTLLNHIFPERSGYWNQKKWNSIRISFLPNIPFGPDPHTLSSFLFDSLYDNIELLINKFALKHVTISGLEKPDKKILPNINYNNRDSRQELSLSALELRKLIDAVKTNQYSENKLLSIFIDTDHIFTYLISSDLSFSDLFSKANELKDYALEDFVDTINGLELSGDSIISQSQINYISLSNWRFKSNSGFFMTYPNFNRSISMIEHIEKLEEPCINCLSCASICPSGIYPATLYHLLKDGALAEASAMALNTCMFCRKCSVVCPSNIPLSKTIIENIIPNTGDGL